LSSTWRWRSAFPIERAAALAKNCTSSASAAVKNEGRSLSTFRQPIVPASLTMGTASSDLVAARPAT
jgi:hypothetical protein